MNPSSHNFGHPSIRDLLKTPITSRTNNFLLTPGFDFNSSQADPDGFSQIANSCRSENEELKFYKGKCEQLQKDVERLQDEKRELELRVFAEKSNVEKVARIMEAQIEKIKAENVSALLSSKLEIDHWKQNTVSIEKELQLLQDQVKNAKSEKDNFMSRFNELQAYKEESERHKRNMDIYLKRHQQQQNDLKRKNFQIKQAILQLEEFLRTQQQQIDSVNVLFPACERQKNIDNAKITELEQQLVALRSANAQQQHQMIALADNIRITEDRANKLRNENEESLNNVAAMAEILDNDTTRVMQLMDQTCQEFYEVVSNNNSATDEGGNELTV